MSWSPAEEAALAALDTPAKIQAFLDETGYSDEPIYRCPRRVLAEKKAHCVDGALFAAAALRRLGHPPLVIDLRAVRDDDHVIAPYRAHGCYGAVAKSNMVGLRFREPIYRTLRELAMSYFEQYYNLEREKSLRSYSVPVDLSELDHLAWTFDDTPIEPVVVPRLDRARHHPLLSPAQIAALSPVDARSFDAGLMGSNPAGLYVPADHE